LKKRFKRMEKTALHATHRRGTKQREGPANERGEVTPSKEGEVENQRNSHNKIDLGKVKKRGGRAG